ncbi:hypothetical protein I6G82_06920 [Lysinibacillus macroides]|uniref:Antigen I/II N-terminal domain-containing protein n=1 Tax=Lysinibacillus macroides TaxID=33935 RepID=A0A0M9DM66_9BACI|nr:hypothetical protein [Lysinibacillus macroides]KOY83460.1 hypothetical protein ADM90_09395 [Lysinibacillus macroides]KOY83463.1 hypothetical protein ADM90_09415 [Lysinibacillus macroides]QPR69334.1 hypothetical protein I6G82_06920 [Lysinibacillus macroides]
MKKILLVSLTVVLGIILAACSEDKKSDELAEVTIPATFFEGQDIDAAIANAKQSGIKEVIKNGDGSVTYKMTTAEHEEMLNGIKEGIQGSINEMEKGEDFQSIKNVTYNDSFSEFTLTVNKEEFEKGLDSIASFGLGIAGMYYQLFNGVAVEDYQVTVNFTDEATDEVIKTIVYPDEYKEQ